MGNLNKVLLSYDAPFWDASIGTFTLLPCEGGPVAHDAPLAHIFARSTLVVSSLCAPNGLPGANASLLVYVGADAAVALEAYSRLEVAAALHAYVAPRLAASASDDDAGVRGRRHQGRSEGAGPHAVGRQTAVGGRGDGAGP